jgi:hypothetical protein
MYPWPRVKRVAAAWRRQPVRNAQAINDIAQAINDIVVHRILTAGLDP